ncbi:hypothetical protein J4466_00485 [Candidatus Pacearchaeota archaeon]|nr:hypothetical protein [Candidatus Pacearchaeota archaeon]
MKNKKSEKYFKYIKSKKMVFLYLAIILLSSFLIFRLLDVNAGILTGNSVKITGEAIKQEQINAEKDKLIKEPVEVKEKRDYNSKTYKNPDGTYTAVISAGNEFFFNGTDFNYIEKISQPRIEKKDIILNRKPFPFRNVFEMGTYILAEGINASIDLETNELVLRDANNNILQILPRPFSVDANNNTLMNNYKIYQKKQKLTISVEVDKTWLDNAKYPVVIDPDTVTITQTYMGQVTLDYATNFYARGVNVTSIGWKSQSQDEGTTYRTFIEFDTTSIPDTSNVTNVTLNISVNSISFEQTPSCSQNMPEVTTSISRFNSSKISNNNTYPTNSTGDEFLYNNISTGYNGLGTYRNGLNYTLPGKEYSIDLGNNSYDDLKGQLTNNFFAIGIYGSPEESTFECEDSVDFNDSADVSGKPKLIVTYADNAAGCTVPGSGDFTCNSTCVFTTQAVTINGGDLYIRDNCNLTLNGSSSISFTATDNYIFIYKGGQLNINNGSGINNV